MILAGLSGSPEMICGTMLALTRIVYQYKGKPILASPGSVASFFDTSFHELCEDWIVHVTYTSLQGKGKYQSTVVLSSPPPPHSFSLFSLPEVLLLFL